MDIICLSNASLPFNLEYAITSFVGVLPPLNVIVCVRMDRLPFVWMIQTMGVIQLKEALIVEVFANVKRNELD